MTIKLALGGLLLTGVLLTTTVHAQQTATPSAPTTTLPVPGQRGIGRQQKAGNGYQAADPATRAKRMTDQLTQSLKLDDATSQKVYALTLARAQTIDAIQTGSDDNRTKNTKLQVNAQDFKSKMQGVLTADQYTQFLAMKHRGGGSKGEQNQKSDSSDSNN